MLMETTIKERTGEHRRIGIYNIESKIWFVERNKKLHFMKLLKGWGLDSKIYDKLKAEYHLEAVILTETSKGRVYKIKVQTIEENKIYKTFHPHRLQLFIPEKYWELIASSRK